MDVRVAVYDPSTDGILRIVNCPVELAPLQAQEGEAIIEVADDVRDTTHKIVDGEAVLIS